jgi:4-hydroxybenzoate polyprenyltransferase
MEDIEGDQKIGLRTLPIAWGKGIARALILFIGLLLFSSFGYIGFLSWSGNIISGSYILFALSLPTFMALVLSIRAKKPSDFHFVSSLLKGVMAAAILSIPVITLSSI